MTNGRLELELDEFDGLGGGVFVYRGDGQDGSPP